MDPLKRSLEKRVNGWIAEESNVTYPRKSSNRRSSTTAYIAGYGVGTGISLLYITIVDELGLIAIRSTLSTALSLLLGILVLAPGVLLGNAIGTKLTKKLKERWANNHEPKTTL
jgi:hypothetical protein